ncbi:competence protein ComK [Priestia flexa]|uniref:competence protein ComK n=1 Tax=Priestia flexa TaxID=86664 RepID=UPI000E6A78A6|nr:competence protein ComK [Priestia flexa]RIV13218.1 competence protein [Priestia flexa]
MEVNENYVINVDTKVLKPVQHFQYQTKIVDAKGEYYSTKTCKELLMESCIQHLTTFEGALYAVRKRFGFTKEPPLVIDKANELIVIPTKSPTSHLCSWYFLSHIDVTQTLSSSKQASQIIYFHDQTHLPTSLSRHSLKEKLSKALTVQHDIRK